ncbi:hypothetical protein PMAYCL1PPCAC_20684, partial [Pristionchus mayeri]
DDRANLNHIAQILDKCGRVREVCMDASIFTNKSVINRFKSGLLVESVLLYWVDKLDQDLLNVSLDFIRNHTVKIITLVFKNESDWNHNERSLAELLTQTEQ